MSHHVDVAPWETLGDDENGDTERSLIHSFWCRSESNPLCFRANSDDTWKEIMARLAIVSDHAAAHWTDDLKASKGCRKPRPTKG